MPQQRGCSHTPRVHLNVHELQADCWWFCMKKCSNLCFHESAWWGMHAVVYMYIRMRGTNRWDCQPVSSTIVDELDKLWWLNLSNPAEFSRISLSLSSRLSSLIQNFNFFGSITLGFFTTFNCLCLLFSINSLALVFFSTALWFGFLFLLTCSIALWLSLCLLFLCSSLAALLPSLSKSLGGGDGVVMQGVLHANGAVAGNGSWVWCSNWSDGIGGGSIGMLELKTAHEGFLLWALIFMMG